MEFRIHTDLPASPARPLDLTSHVLLMGSCFAQGVGERLTDALPDGHVLVNPFGTVFNPLSICRCLSFLIDDTADISPYIFHGHDGLWHSWLHATRFSATTRELCLERVEAQLATARAFLRQTDWLCLTWGTAYVFELTDVSWGGGLQTADIQPASSVVTNCHKEPSASFTHRRTTVEEIARQTLSLIQRLHALRPDLQILLTISPYRYARSGLHQSTLSKSVLHLAAERVCEAGEVSWGSEVSWGGGLQTADVQQTSSDAEAATASHNSSLITHNSPCPAVHYFPAYEIVIDELRDYRFYEADMLHPSAVATDYVWERFRSWCFTPELEQFAAAKLKQLRAEHHRPLLT